jgi:ABC-type transport system involved in cytochrome c biogenesis permease subunit
MSQTVLAMLAVALAAPPSSGAKLPGALDLTTVRAVTTQHNGRWPPLDTVARDLVESVTGDPFHQDRDPVLLLLAWTFDSQRWVNEPLIEISNAELRAALELPATQEVFSYAELSFHRPLLDLIDDLAKIERGRKMNPLESKVSDLNEKMMTLRNIFSEQSIRLIPNATGIGESWRPIRSSSQSPGGEVPAREAWASLRDAFLKDDASAFAAASDRLVEALEAMPAAYRPGPAQITTELRYNRLRPFQTAWIVIAIGAAFAALALLVQKTWFDRAAVLPLIAGFGLLTYGLYLRWQVAGRIPASNMFESLLFLSWGMGLFAILAMFMFKYRLVPLTASFMAALSLFLADILPLDSYIRPIPPVLMDTVWMSIHVPVIMVSYSVLALGVLIAHLQVVSMALAPSRRELAASIDALHYWYIHVGSILLLAGIVTGSMWGASSWGRYWGWDPKEVWSLAALLGYLTILHVRAETMRARPWAYALGGLIIVGVFVMVAVRLGRDLPDANATATLALALVGTALAVVLFIFAHGSFATAAKSILCFWLIIMTYVGVNFVLGIGLHSYGFGTGAVAKYMFGLGATDIALLGVLSLVYLLRRRSPKAAGFATHQVTAG